MNTHINNIAARANRTLGFVKRNVQTKNSLVRPQVELNMGQWSGALTRKKIETKLKWFKEGQPDGCQTYSSVTEMMSNLGWRSLENRRYDARLLMFYKIVYGLVAIPVPSYFERLEVYTCHTHPLAYIFCMLLSILIFPHDCGSKEQITSWTRPQSSILILTPSKQESERSITHTHSKANTVFNLLLAPSY